MLEGTYVGIDLETTGVDFEKDRVIEIGLVKLKDSEIIDEYNVLVNPLSKLPLKIKKLTGIDDAVLSNAPTIDKVLSDILKFIGQHPFIGHNVSFDKSFLERALLSMDVKRNVLENECYDTFELARIVMPDVADYKLETLCKMCNIEIDAYHRALIDAKQSVKLTIELLKKIKEKDVFLLADLILLLEQARSPWCKVLKKIYKTAVKNEFDRKIISYNRDSIFFDENVQKSNEFVNDDNLSSEKCIISEKEVIEYFSQDGILSKHIDSYEYRVPQLDMAKALTKTLNDGGYLLVEAGTGTGKSIAYLLPAAIWAVKNNQRVVISTHTINLQEQLCNKDIPLLKSLPQLDFKAVLLKGRNHYICMQKWQTVKDLYKNNKDDTQNLSEREASFYARILMWISSTLTGDCGELNILPQEYDLWGRICAERDTCLGNKCRFFNDICFVNRAKRAADKANIIIVNHSLIFADIKAENKVLPHYDVLIIDEAHHLENSASTNLGVSIARSDVMRWLNNLNNIISRLTKYFSGGKRDSSSLLQIIKELKNVYKKTHEKTSLFFNALSGFIKEKLQDNDSFKSVIRLKSECCLSGVNLEINSTVNAINELCDLLSQAIDEISMMEDYENIVKEAILIFEKGLSIAADISYTFDYSNKDIVRWIEKGHTIDGVEALSLYAVPVEIGEMLYSHLYTQKKSIIFTSATLTVDGAFDYFIERVGLDLIDKDQLRKIKLDSPFEYEKQSLLFIVNDLPNPVLTPEKDYASEVVCLLKDLVVEIGGRTLVLFTSHKMLKEVYYAIKPDVEEKGILILGHAIDGGRTRLIEEFANTDRAVLFGASSFWEGVDIPGECLSCVVLVKLPFWPPNIPIIEARHELLSKQSKNGFENLSLPEAVIKFKQGFGRLIRKNSDFGAVIVLDRRIIEKRYGLSFLRSLPVNTYMKGNRYQMISTIKRWLS